VENGSSNGLFNSHNLHLNEKGEVMIRFECTIGGHNKYYEFHRIESNGRVTVKGMYGAIGQAPKEATIYDGDNTVAAEQETQRKVREKQKKGYIIVNQNGTSEPAQKQKKTVTSR
jgi:predicted DNA-binding WGR domain protein